MSSPRKLKKPDLLDDRGPSRVAALFDKKLLSDELTVEIALADFERRLYGGGVRAEALLEEVEHIPFLLDFVLSGVSGSAFEALEAAILGDFPTAAEPFRSSVHAALLSRLSKSLLLPYPRVSKAPPEFIAHQKDVETASLLLEAVARLRFDGDAHNDSTVDDPKRLAKRKAQARRRSSAASVPSPVVEKAPFLGYGVRPPTTQAEAATLTSTILSQQRAILQFYLRAFRQELHSSFFRAAYLPPPSSQERISPVVEDVQDIVPDLPSNDEENSAARPLGHPVTASLYMDGIESFGDWQILTSTKAQRDLRKARKEDSKKFKIIVKKIQELSKGHFSDDNHKKLFGLNVGVPVYEAKMSRDLRLVYQIHCAPDVGTNTERQVICIFGIYTHAQLDGRFWDAMSRTLADRGAEYKKRCLFRNRATYRRGDNVVLPGEFPPRDPEEAVQPSQPVSELSQDQMDQLRTLVLEGYVKFSKSFLNSILADQDVAHVFDVSQREKEIIEHPHSCIVIGRSGTGKTTTILFKMLGIERSSEALAQGTGKPRQLFVTQSRVLAEKVEDYYEKLQQSLATAKCTPAELKEMAAKGAVQRRQHLANADEEVYWRTDLPKRYSALEDGHFPMFLTYDHLCRLLENEFDSRLLEAEKQRRVRDVLREALELPSRAPKSEVPGIGYKAFQDTYWSHFPQELVKGLNPDVVFGEFLGVIQGSEKALDSATGHLSREDYCSITRRTLIVDSDQREAMYDLFLLYRKKKKQLWHRDAADRAFDLVQALRKDGLPGKTVDFLYVDEAQDNLLIDTFVLRALCPNLHGMFWAGDTAQTISAGSTFRFSELKAFLHRLAKTSSDDTPPDPKMFHLTANYRSHVGIVDCAASVVELITGFWPDAVDSLPREKGMTVGPKPIFFWGERAAGFDSFISEDTGSTIEFGARQCILVRDQAAKERLRSQVGQIGIILTIPESKGLEFDDVLLYNPFGDSPEDYQRWRVILNKVPGYAAPDFGEARHSGICRELKFLYVGITRARMNLWIMDSSNKGEPMRLFWERAGLIQSHVPGSTMPRLAVSSSKTEWAEVAGSLFHKQQYSEAELAFARAGLPRERQVARAYHLRSLATASSAATRAGGRLSPQASRYYDAARAFMGCAKEAPDAQDRETYYRIAGKCYADAGDDRAAAQAFYEAGFYESAATHYRAAGMFDEAVAVVQRHQVMIETSVVESIISVSKLQYLRKNETEKARALFHSEDEALNYMSSYGLETPRATLLEQLGRYSEAAQCQLSEGNLSGAIELFLRDRQNPESVARAARSLLDALWPEFSFTENLARSPEMDEASGPTSRQALLRLLGVFREVAVDGDVRDEMDMFRALSRCDVKALLDLRRRFKSFGNEAALLLCLDKVFSMPLRLGSLSPSDVASCFTVFLEYARTMQRLACQPDPCGHPAVQKLFTFTAYDEDHCLLHEGTRLLSGAERQPIEHASNGWRGVVILRHELTKLIKIALREQLLQRVKAQNEECHQLRSLRLCFLFATSRGRCPRGNECPNFHAPAGRHSPTDYNVFVRVHLLQIMIYNTLYATDVPSRELFKQQRAWLRRLYEALYPQHFMLGGVHLLSTDSIHELDEGRHIVAVWIKDFLNTLEVEHPWNDWSLHVFRSNLLRATRLAMLFDDSGASRNMHLIPCMFPSSWPPLGRLRDETGRQVQHLVHAMQGSDPDALDRGVLFLNHILSKRLSIDIGVLCDFMDQLCGFMIAAKRLRAGRSLHDVTLPKSWVARIIAALPSLEDKSTRRAVVYKSHFTNLLQQVYSGNDSTWHLYFEHVDLSRMGSYRTRNVLVARICKNLCLWGYNLCSPDLRQDIMKSISAITTGQCDIVLSSVVSPYLYATSWNGLAKAVRASTTGSDLDEMVQLWDIRTPMPRDSLPHVRRVPFARHSDISALAGFGHPFATRVEPTAATSSAQALVGLGPSADKPSLPTAPVLIDGPEDDDMLVLDHQQSGLSGRTSPALEDDNFSQGEEEAPILSSHELAAATVIAGAFQKYWSRVQEKRDGLQETRRRIYAQFRAQIPKRRWSSPPCRMLFLGALPHAYVGLECTKGHLSAAMAGMKGRLKTVNHRELENLLTALDQLTVLFDEASRLHLELAPAAQLYNDCDTETIKASVLRVDGLVRTVVADREEAFAWQGDVNLAKSIVSE